MVDVQNKSMVEQIIEILQDILETDAVIGVEDDLSKFGLDSMRSVSLIVELENAFQVMFDDSELVFDNFSTINKIVALVQKKL